MSFRDPASLSYGFAKHNIDEENLNEYFGTNINMFARRENSLLKMELEKTEAIYIDQYNLFCDFSKEKTLCDLYNHSLHEYYIFDGVGHFTPEGLREFGKRLNSTQIFGLIHE